MSDPRSAIPSVDRLLLDDGVRALVAEHGHDRVVGVLRDVIAEVRASIGRGEVPGDPAAPGLYAGAARNRLDEADRPSLAPVVNATGVVLHTNLGRAPLARAAVEAMELAARGYSNLEYDVEEGRRGSRYVHCVSLLTELTGAEDALVVNNAAAGLMLALNTLARGGGVLVSRGELVEIGGGFRIPEILERSGAVLVEVGSTNRTRAIDYEREFEEQDDGPAIERPEVRAILKVHRSNFRISGFTEEASVDALAELARARGVPFVYDLGSGLLTDPEALRLPPEPRPAEAVAAGADLVVFSGDKLLGGPQAGVVVGRAEYVAALRSNPMCRALRVDKTTLAGLEATLRLYRRPEHALREIPTLRMLGVSAPGARRPGQRRGRAPRRRRRPGRRRRDPGRRGRRHLSRGRPPLACRRAAARGLRSGGLRPAPARDPSGDRADRGRPLAARRPDAPARRGRDPGATRGRGGPRMRATVKKPRPAVFLDRDGTLIREREYLAHPDGVELVPGAVEALRALEDAGLPYAIITNQSGIARGLYSEDDYRAVAARLDELLRAAGVPPVATRHCPHHPDVTGPCDCRKPGLGMYRSAAEEADLALAGSFYVGDKPTDVEPARALGGQGILVRTGYGRESAARVTDDVVVVDDLPAAIGWILGEVGGGVDPVGGRG